MESFEKSRKWGVWDVYVLWKQYCYKCCDGSAKYNFENFTTDILKLLCFIAWYSVSVLQSIKGTTASTVSTSIMTLAAQEKAQNLHVYNKKRSITITTRWDRRVLQEFLWNCLYIFPCEQLFWNTENIVHRGGYWWSRTSEEAILQYKELLRRMLLAMIVLPLVDYLFLRRWYIAFCTIVISCSSTSFKIFEHSTKITRKTVRFCWNVFHTARRLFWIPIRRYFSAQCVFCTKEVLNKKNVGIRYVEGPGEHSSMDMKSWGVITWCPISKHIPYHRHFQEWERYGERYRNMLALEASPPFRLLW